MTKKWKNELEQTVQSYEEYIRKQKKEIKLLKSDI